MSIIVLLASLVFNSIESVAFAEIECKVLKYAVVRCPCRATVVSCGDRIGYVYGQELNKFIPEASEQSVGKTFKISDYSKLPLFASMEEGEDREIKESNCLYVNDSGEFSSDREAYPLKITDSAECKKYNPFSKVYLANIRCGSQNPAMYACPLSIKGAGLIDAKSCVDSNTKEDLKKIYFGSEKKSGTNKSKWADSSPESVPYQDPRAGNMILTREENPFVSVKDGVSACIGHYRFGRGSGIAIGPANKDGSCNLKDLIEDKCFQVESTAINNDNKFNPRNDEIREDDGMNTKSKGTNSNLEKEAK